MELFVGIFRFFYRIRWISLKLRELLNAIEANNPNVESLRNECVALAYDIGITFFNNVEAFIGLIEHVGVGFKVCYSRHTHFIFVVKVAAKIARIKVNSKMVTSIANSCQEYYDISVASNSVEQIITNAGFVANDVPSNVANDNDFPTDGSDNNQSMIPANDNQLGYTICLSFASAVGSNVGLTPCGDRMNQVTEFRRSVAKIRERIKSRPRAMSDRAMRIATRQLIIY